MILFLLQRWCDMVLGLVRKKGKVYAGIWGGMGEEYQKLYQKLMSLLKCRS